jgi:single-strand DNA-binding protein
VANNIQLLGGGPGPGGSGPSNGQGGGYQEHRNDSGAERPPRESGPPSGGDDGFTDDIPF